MWFFSAFVLLWFFMGRWGMAFWLIPISMIFGVWGIIAWVFLAFMTHRDSKRS